MAERLAVLLLLMANIYCEFQWRDSEWKKFFRFVDFRSLCVRVYSALRTQAAATANASTEI